MAVVFAMLMSYFLSRTIVPTMVRFLLGKEAEEHAAGHDKPKTGRAARFFAAFDRGFEHLRTFYGRVLALALHHRVVVAVGFLVLVAVSMCLLPLIGRDFFPTVDAGLIKLHVRGTPGTRLEETERTFAEIEATIKTVIPAAEIDTMLDILGIPTSGINLSLSEGALALRRRTARSSSRSRRATSRPTATCASSGGAARARYPEQTFFFFSRSTSRDAGPLNLGLAAPIDVQVTGAIGAEDQSYAVAQEIAEKVRSVPGAADIHLGQVQRVPELKMDVDRVAAGQAEPHREASCRRPPGLALVERRGQPELLGRQARRAVPGRGADTAIQGEFVQRRRHHAARHRHRLWQGAAAPVVERGAAWSRIVGPANITHYNVARTFDVQINVEGSDLGSVASGVQDIVDKMKPNLPRGTVLKVKGRPTAWTRSP